MFKVGDIICFPGDLVHHYEVTDKDNNKVKLLLIYSSDEVDMYDGYHDWNSIDFCTRHGRLLTKLEKALK